MARDYYDRYGQFKLGGDMAYIPFIQIGRNSTDIKVVYGDNKRLDKLSNEYYGTPFYGWLILLANPQFGGMEFDIPNKTILRIPFPLMDALSDYQSKVEKYLRDNGNE
jgi:hypothetical protein